MHKLTTVWGESLDKNRVLPEYPRPQMERESYINLNGEWELEINRDCEMPEVFSRRILVPFAPEAPLSGVGHVLQPGEYLWYRRSFEYLSSDKRLLLHFGAVDREACIWVNKKPAGKHIGGYTPFTLDITEFVTNGTNELVVSVNDNTDMDFHASGKQKLEHGGMFYTPVSGIWQTVWLEEVPDIYISRLKFTPHYDEAEAEFAIEICRVEKRGIAAEPEGEEDTWRPELRINGEIRQYRFADTAAPITGECIIRIPMGDFISWSPENPYLYTYELKLKEDRIKGYFAMRKIEVSHDKRGIPRLFLNNRPYFHNGLLDQGYWPDGLYTAPTDEALCHDIKKCRELGFNMLRKHAKTEPLRWYYHCDRLGMLVWQDIVNGGAYEPFYMTYRPTVLAFTQTRTDDVQNRHLGRNSKESRLQYESELKATMEYLYNSPSVVVWVLFNEGWGQFDSSRIYALAKEADPTRVIDAASGWYDCGAGDLKSLHIYFTSFKFKPDKRPVVISEFGGYSLPTEGHVCCDRVYGYRKFTDRAAFTSAWEKLYRDRILAQLDRGLCAAVYTQVSDIEEEINGLLTYDRKVVKIDSDVVHKMNIQLKYDE